MAQESINQLRQSIDKLKDVIDTVEAKRLLASREADSPYLTELLSVSDKLHMIKSTVDALISKLPQSSEITQTRQPKGRDNRDSGLPSVDSTAFSSRDSSFLEDKEFSSSGMYEIYSKADDIIFSYDVWGWGGEGGVDTGM
ncbi:uncharacterized protein LOC132547164 [Ylistrum balloti]|uniref:uncharacterized protein LOC132547164 n=1 Tax=Ylistrum balloti TaxID=509963 RepID=UPI0029059F34|nr:uncharacterized protein LOC132547164 [Ylistrum balloti]